MTQVNKWLEGMFYPEETFSRGDIKRWLSQKCIGYQVNGGQHLSVFSSQIELYDGSIKDIWELVDWDAGPSQIYYKQPPIDIENK